MMIAINLQYYTILWLDSWFYYGSITLDYLGQLTDSDQAN